jgi:hypothetical protein
VPEKKSEAELNFLDFFNLLREKPTIAAFLKYRLSSALLDFERAKCGTSAGKSAARCLLASLGGADGEPAVGESSSQVMIDFKLPKSGTTGSAARRIAAGLCPAGGH